jgi:hypothetical protein
MPIKCQLEVGGAAAGIDGQLTSRANIAHSRNRLAELLLGDTSTLPRHGRAQQVVTSRSSSSSVWGGAQLRPTG